MDVIKLRFLRKGDYRGLSAWAQCNCKGPYKRKSGESVSLVDVMAEARDWNNAWKPKKAGKWILPSVSPGGTSPAKTLILAR